jgi:3',5'-cyclic AMP phosphodiesterase CpdA
VRVLVHLSDLHFGTEDALVTEALRGEVERLNPAVTIVSGDLTQRARRGQFAAAARFLAGIPGRQLVVPGNHDIPLAPARRFLAPLERFRRYISPDLNPFHCDDEVAILGLNTARAWSMKSGRVSYSQMDLIRQRLGALPAALFKVVVTHHPFVPPSSRRADLVGRANPALEALTDARVDLLLAGHHHRAYVGDVRSHYPHVRRAILVAQASTSTSRRLRGEPNAFNSIVLDGDEIRLTSHVWAGTRFAAGAVRRYARDASGWSVAHASGDDPPR